MRSVVQSRIGFSLLLLAVCIPAAAADKGWIEVRSPHFRVLSDGAEKDARRVAREFEQIRAVFAMTFPALRLDSGAPLLVLAPRDESSAKALLPRMWKQKGAKPAGLFSHGWEKQFAVVRLDEVSPQAYEVVYHEYAHTLLHLNMRWLPVWMDEGLAEFYAGTRFEQNKLYIGAPVRRAPELRMKPLIPVDTLIAVTQASPYYHDEDKIQMFYAESWALTHFLMFSPAMEQGKRFRQFLVLLDKGVEQKKAFVEAIGDFKAVDKDLDDYTHRFTIQAMMAKNPPNFSEKDFSFRQLTPAETQAELGAFHLWDHDTETARTLILQALSGDSGLGLAHEDMGFLDFADGKDPEAARGVRAGVSPRWEALSLCLLPCHAFICQLCCAGRSERLSQGNVEGARGQSAVCPGLHSTRASEFAPGKAGSGLWSFTENGRT